MATERTQHFGNHTQWTPLFHFAASPLSMVYFVWSIRRLIVNPNTDSVYAAVGATALMTGVFVSRLMSLKVQDRVIRLEERLRLTRVLPADLQPHILGIRAGHLVALRFASDAELPELVRAIVKDPTIKPKELKQRVKNWQPDFFRA